MTSARNKLPTFRATVEVGLTALGFVVVLSSSSPQLAIAREPSWSLFSHEERAFAPLKAAPQEARFHIGLLLNDDGLFEDLAWGGDLAMLEGRFGKGSILTVSGRGLMTGRFDVSSESFDLLNVDFVGGIAVGYSTLPFGAELLLYHQSSHLGDELLEGKKRDRIDYGVEELRLLADWRWPALRMYAGGKVTLHAYPASLSGRTVLQAGVELSGKIAVLPAFVAADFQTRLDEPGLHSATMRAGLGLHGAKPPAHVQQLFLEFYSGRSVMGQFFMEQERHVLLGISYLFQ